MDIFNYFKDLINNNQINTIFRISTILLFSGIIFFVLHKWLSFVIWKITGKKKTRWMEVFYKRRFFNKIAYLIIPIVAYIILDFWKEWKYEAVTQRFIDVWLTCYCIYILHALLNVINGIYETYPMSRNRPITVFIQIIKIFLWCIGIVITISILLNKSPEKLVVGLGAFAAVLMLIFKDSILGFVAGVQLMANNMIRIGDWIVMSSNNANGTVLEINLYTVKVQNWDMTISTIPTYQLISQSFINWRGMEESRGRRIQRWIYIDIDSVHFLSTQEISKLQNSTFLKDYIEQMLNMLNKLNQNKATPYDEQRLTNIGIFRKYMDLWIEANPDINTSMTHMVRQLQPTPTGIPLEIYCFSAKQEWKLYESIQADIFDHTMAIIPLFGLRVFQYPTDHSFTPFIPQSQD